MLDLKNEEIPEETLDQYAEYLKRIDLLKKEFGFCPHDVLLARKFGETHNIYEKPYRKLKLSDFCGDLNV